MTLSRTDVLIVNELDWRYLGRTYQPGDRFDWTRIPGADPKRIERLIEHPNRRLLPLTRASMIRALKLRREGGNAPRGFTPAGLIQQGLLTEEEVVARGWLPGDDTEEVDETDAGSDAGGEDKGFRPPVGSVQVGNLWVVPAKTAGGPKRYDVVDEKGQRIFSGGTIVGEQRAKDRAEQFIKDRDRELERQQQQQQADAGRGEPPPPPVDDQAEAMWRGFPDEPSEWTDEQVAAFNAYYDAMEDGAALNTEHPGVLKVFRERVAADADDTSRGAGEPATDGGQGTGGADGSDVQQEPDGGS